MNRRNEKTNKFVMETAHEKDSWEKEEKIE